MKTTKKNTQNQTANTPSGHTPEPWHVGFSTDVGDETPRSLAVFGNPEYRQPGMSGNACIVCEVSPVAAVTPQDLANARLIAAAPELVRVVEMLVHCQNYAMQGADGRAVVSYELQSILTEAGAALAKAKKHTDHV